MRAYCMLEAKSSNYWGIFDLEDSVKKLGYPAHTLLGPYDAIALLEGTNVKEINDSVRIIREKVGSLGRLTTYLVTKEIGTPFIKKPFAYVLSETKPVENEKIMRRLFQQGGVVSSSMVYGPFSIISEVVANTLGKFGTTLQSMRSVEGSIRHIPFVCAPRE